MVTFLPGVMMVAVTIGAMTATGTSKHIDDNPRAVSSAALHGAECN